MIKACNWVNVIINVEDGKVVHNRIAKCHKHRNGLVYYFNGDKIVYAIEENVAVQMIEGIEKDYCKRHNYKPLDTDEVIYVI